RLDGDGPRTALEVLVAHVHRLVGAADLRPVQWAGATRQPVARGPPGALAASRSAGPRAASGRLHGRLLRGVVYRRFVDGDEPAAVERQYLDRAAVLDVGSLDGDSGPDPAGPLLQKAAGRARSPIGAG